MAEYTRAQLLTAFRQDHPELANVKDNDLFAAIAQDSPELARGISELKQAAPVNEMPDERSAAGVAWDQTKKVVGGIGSGLAAVPIGIAGLAGTAAGVAKDTLMGDHMSAGKRIVDTGKAMGSAVKGMAEDTLRPISGAIAEVVAPGKYEPVTREENERAAHAAGENLGATVGGEIVGKAAGVAGRAAKTFNNPEALQLLAERAKAFRPSDVSLPGGISPTVRAANTVVNLGKTIAAPITNRVGRALETRARQLAGPTETTIIPEYTPTPRVLDEPVQSPVRYDKPDNVPPTFTEPAAEAMTRDQLMALSDEARAALPEDQYWAAYKNDAAPYQAPTPQPPTPRDAMGQPVQDFLDPLRQVETPEQLYERQQQLRNVEFQPDPTVQQPTIGAQRPAPQQVPQSPTPTGLDAPLPEIAPEVIQIAEAVLDEGKPRSPANVQLAIENAEYLLKEIPELNGLPPGKTFNTRLFNGFQRIGHELKATEASIPRDRSVPVADAVSKLSDIQNNAARFGENPAVKSIQKLKDLLGETTITWEEFIKHKRSFFDEVDLSSAAGREAYQVLKELSNEVSPALGKLNQSWFTAKTAMELAAMDVYRGFKKSIVPKAKALRK
jgi:hypothetical protein